MNNIFFHKDLIVKYSQRRYNLSNKQLEHLGVDYMPLHESGEIISAKAVGSQIPLLMDIWLYWLTHCWIDALTY